MAVLSKGRLPSFPNSHGRFAGTDVLLQLMPELLAWCMDLDTFIVNLLAFMIAKAFGISQMLSELSRICR